MSLGESTELLIGADPELFVFNRKTGKAESAHNYIPGSKYDPFGVDKGAIQVDGVAAEFNIIPASSVEEFYDNISTVLQALTAYLRQKAPDCYLAAIPVADFEKEYFDSLPPETKLLGCEPDYNAYTKKVNPTPDAKVAFRTGSGHVHLGWTNGADYASAEHFNDCCEIVRQLDASLFIPSHIWDVDKKRRSLYGNRGAFRPKSYGVEYRVLSNAWLADPALIEWVYSSTAHAYKLLEEGVRLQEDSWWKHFNKQTDKVYLPKQLDSYMGFMVDHGFLPIPEECYV